MENKILESAIDRVLARIDATIDQPGEGFPHYADQNTGVWTRSPAGDWTGGFWVGMLWLAAWHTKELRYHEQARIWAERLGPRAASKSVFKGFLFWYGAELGAELLHDETARNLSLAGTRGLLDMYNPQAQLIPLGNEAEEASDVGSNEANIDALPGPVPLLIKHAAALDSLEIARNHLRQHIALCVRDDGSVCQSASFDPKNGALLRRYTHKGIHGDSTWTRAQAWAMVSFAQALNRGEMECRDVAVQVADWWLEHQPKDHVAYWDFDDPAIPATSRDTSGTAIAAAALLKLAVCLPERRERYQQAAEAMVEALVLRYLTPLDGNDPRPVGILTHGCFNRKLGVAMENELIWGDYFLFEALLVLAASLASERV